MNAVLIKILATALALSQVTTRPDAVKTQFDPVGDRTEVVELLQAGCAHIRKAFDIEQINLDDLISTAMDDPKAITGDVKVFRGINFGDLYTAYRQFCRNETVPDSPIDIGEVIDFYDRALTDLPDASEVKTLKLPGTSTVYAGDGSQFAEVSRPGHRRIWVALSDIPKSVQDAFIAAEDKRFYRHKGVDEHGLVRAFVANMVHPGRPEGGSTITQQVAKNLLVGDAVTYKRKIREVVEASRMEQVLSKPQILALYLNSIYLGRGAWGIEMAARRYFAKPAKSLTLAEGALLATLAKGPAYFNPDRHADRARERYAYVLGRMKEDGYLSADAERQALGALPQRTAEEQKRRDSGFHFVDYLGHEARARAGIASLTGDSYTVHSTLNPQLQRAAEAALQEGLAHFEMRTGRAEFKAPEANLSEAIAQIAAKQSSPAPTPAWQQALAAAQLPLYDVHWTPAIVLRPADTGRRGRGTMVGLADGRVLPLSTGSVHMRQALKPDDVIYVHIRDHRGRQRAELRARPQVQGAAVAIDNKTGRILAMAGAFSYPLSQLNRVTQTRRQPGSAFKPFTYLAALHNGLQPNTLVQDQPITLRPVGAGSMVLAPEFDNDNEHYDWSPKNFDGSALGVMTLRRGLERSRNLVTAHLLDGGIDYRPEQSLAAVCALAKEAQIYKDCVPHYPFVLGAQAVRLIDLAAFYAAIADEGAYIRPYAIESIERKDQMVYRHRTEPPRLLASGDRVAFYQLKTMLEGVVARGTAYSMHALAPDVAGKTGTSDDGNDAWFVGFSNDVTVGVWVGYDNGNGKRRTLGGAETGAKVAIPIFEPIIRATWKLVAPRSPLKGPSRQAREHLLAIPIDLKSGDPVPPGTPGAFMEQFRVGLDGQADDTEFRLVSRYDAEAFREQPYDDRLYGRDPSQSGDFWSYSRGRGWYRDDRGYGGYGGRDDGRYDVPSPGNFLEQLFGLRPWRR